MVRVAVLAGLLLSSSLVLAADPAAVDADFQKAVASSGDAYVPFRDALVGSASHDFLKKKSESGNLQEKVVARAVLGWKEHGKLYGERINGDLYLSKPGNLLFQWGNDASVLQAPELIPLALEMLIKNSAGEPGLFAGVRIIGANGRNRIFKDHDILFEYLSVMPPPDDKPRPPSDKEKAAIAAAGGDPNDPRRRNDLAVLVAQAVAGLPVDQVPAKRVVEALYKIGKYPNMERGTDGERKADKERITKVASMLAGSLVRAAQQMSPADKAELIKTLTSEEELLGAVGPEVALHVAGSIGGPQSVKALGNYLRDGKDAKDEREILKQKWAIQLLARMKDGEGAATLQQYARDSQMPAKGRAIALEQLVRVKYTEEIGDTLKSVLEDNDAPTPVRFEALRSLDQYLRVNKNNPDIAGPVRSAIVETSFTPDEASGYQAAAQQIKDIARETM